MEVCGKASMTCNLGDGDSYQLNQAVSAMKSATFALHCQKTSVVTPRLYQGAEYDF